MSHVTHRVLAVTTFREEYAEEAIGILKGMIPKELLTDIFESPINSYFTFLVLPCGSKAGWSDEEEHLNMIDFVEGVIKEFDYDDGSNPFNYGLLEYGEFEGWR